MTEIIKAHWGPRLLVLTLFFLTVILYGVFRSENLFLGPTIKITAPNNGLVTKDPFIELTGQAKRIAEINLEGRKIFTDHDGFFKEPLLLAKGYNLITIEAHDRFGRRTATTLKLVLE